MSAPEGTLELQERLLVRVLLAASLCPHLGQLQSRLDA